MVNYSDPGSDHYGNDNKNINVMCVPGGDLVPVVAGVDGQEDVDDISVDGGHRTGTAPL